MKHLILCREYPPAPGGGIGVYVDQISRLLAERGETVHVIGQMWEGAQYPLEERANRRLVVHRLPLEDWRSTFRPRPHPLLKGSPAHALFRSGFSPQAFAWQAGLLAERIIEEEGIDLVEAQEYEAPLYYFLLRRELGIGPLRQPPCMIHLHSPTEFIARYNDWAPDSVWVETAKRLEDYCISNADALLCPSRTFAGTAQAHYRLTETEIQVIPLPLGSSQPIARKPETWQNGSIVYVGRLERRKGVLEWLNAATAVARQFSKVRFEFVGANILGSNKIESEMILRDLVAEDLQDRFIFWGEQNRAFLHDFLSRARLAAIPSRWENFPYTCIEAMCSGLPVIATRRGGMVEMVKDGNTGWLVNEPNQEGLVEALRAALDTPAETLAGMGRQASQDIQLLCDNQRVLVEQLEFRQRVVEKDTDRSVRLYTSPPRSPRQSSADAQKPALEQATRAGSAVMLLATDNLHLFRETLRSIAAQVEKPSVVALVLPEGLRRSEQLLALAGEYLENFRVIEIQEPQITALRAAVLISLLDYTRDMLGVLFVQAGTRLSGEAVKDCLMVLQHCPGVGVVSFWTQVPSRLSDIRFIPNHALPYSDGIREASSGSVYRVQALMDVLPGNGDHKGDLSDKHLYSNDAFISAGWKIVTIPKVLATGPPEKPYGQLQSKYMDSPYAGLKWRDLRLMLRHPIRTTNALLSIANRSFRRARSLD